MYSHFTSIIAASSKHICTCFECGFHSAEHPVPCKHRAEHTTLCKECMDSFCIFDQLYRLHDQAHSNATRLNLFENDMKLVDDFELWERQISHCQRKFYKYRAHLAQAEDERLFDAQFYQDLQDDEAVVILDFKMKILARSYREAQIDWFAKRGFSLLGALILLPSENESQQKAVYHFFLSGDTTQDAEYVNTVKHYLYANILPLYGIKKVHFRCDGAGCFVSSEIKAEFAHWERRTEGKVKEISYKNNVPGKGKSSLDGQFGVFTQVLNGAVDEGESFTNEKELFKICEQYPLENTYYLPQYKTKYLRKSYSAKRVILTYVREIIYFFRRKVLILHCFEYGGL